MDTFSARVGVHGAVFGHASDDPTSVCDSISECQLNRLIHLAAWGKVYGDGSFLSAFRLSCLSIHTYSAANLT